MIHALLLLQLLAPAPLDAKGRAEALTRRAMVEYDGGELDAALADAKAAYAIAPLPNLLFNLGQIHRALHHWEEAAFSYRAYLRVRPDAPDRAAVERLIREMDAKRQSPPASPPAAAPAQVPLVIVASPPTQPPPKPRSAHLAVLDVRPQGGVSHELAQSVTSVVVLEVRRQAGGGATVVGADEIRTMVGFEKQKSALGCDSGSCLAEIGGALGADRLVIGSLSRFGENYLLDLRLLDSRTAKVLAEGSKRFQREGDVLDAVTSSVESLFPSLAPKPKPTVPAEAKPSAPAPQAARAVVAAGPTLPAPAAAVAASAPRPRRRFTPTFWALGATGIAAGVAGAIAWVLASNDRAGYTGAAGPQPITYAQFQQGDAPALTGDILVPLGSVLLAAGIGFALFGSPPAPAAQ